MKKIVIAAGLMTAVGIASAAEVAVSGAYDYNAEKWGTRVTATFGSGALKPQASVTYVQNLYTRYGLGAELGLAKVGPVKLGATAAGVYQATAFGGDNGYGVTAGLKATVDVTKQLSVVGTVERFYGQERIKAYDGTVASVGVSYKF